MACSCQSASRGIISAGRHRSVEVLMERCEGEGLESVRPGDDMICSDVICYGAVLCAMKT